MTVIDVIQSILLQIDDARMVIDAHYPKAIADQNQPLIDFLDAEKIRFQKLEDLQRNELSRIYAKCDEVLKNREWQQKAVLEMYPSSENI